MKKVLLIALVFTFLLNNVEAKKKTVSKKINPASILKNEVDSMSYALGISMGNDIHNYLNNIPGGKSNKNILIKALESAVNGDTTLFMSKENAQNYYRDYITKAQAKENELKKGVGEKFLAENKLKEGVQTTASGLQYMVIKSSDGAKPDPTDTVKVHYTGSLIDGKVFDSSVERGEPIEFPLNGVIPGWSEGVQLMTVGSKYKFFIPYQLAYGDRGIPQAGIPGFAPLIFEVELLAVKKVIPAIKVEEVKSEPVETVAVTTEPVKETKKENFFSKIFRKSDKQKENTSKETTTNKK